MTWMRPLDGRSGQMTAEAGQAVETRQILFSERHLIAAIEGVLSNFEAVWQANAHQTEISIAGGRFHLRSEHPDYLTQVRRALASCTAPTRTDCRIAVATLANPALSAPLWPKETFRERQMEALLSATPYRLHYFPELQFWQLYDCDRAIGLQIMPKNDGFPPWDPGSPLRNFLQWHLGSNTASLLHAGTLGLGGRGVLLAGAGGSGKSSTVLAGIFDGLASVGDDYVLVETDTLTARPVFETLKQDRAGLERLSRLAHPAIPRATNWQGKYQFYMPDVSPQPLARALSLSALLLPEITGGNQTSLTPVTSKEAFLALAPSGVTQIHCDRQRLFSVAAEVARKLPAYRLRLGTDPQEIVQALRGFLEAP